MNEKKYLEATVIGIGLIIITLIAAIIVRNTNFTYDSYTQFRAISSIISLILRIIIIIWIVNIAKDLKRDQFGWGVFAFFLPSIALIVIGQKKEKIPLSKKEFNITMSNDNNDKHKINDYSRNFTEQKNILNDLRTSEVLSVSEYENKLNLILKNEDQINKQEIDEIIKIKVNKRIEPFLNKLSELTKLHVLTVNEFEQKKEELINKYTKIVQDENDPSTINSDYDIERISKYDLTGVEIMGVTSLERKLNEGDVILKSKETKIINIYSKTDLNNLISINQIDKYYLIEL
jgi:hypothetical protein